MMFPFGAFFVWPREVDDFRPRTLRPTIEDVVTAHMALIAARAITGVDEMALTTGVTVPKCDATDNAPKRIEITPWSGNCEAKGAIQLYAGEPHLNVIVTNDGGRYHNSNSSISLCLQSADARKLRDALNEKYPGYVAPPTKSYKVKSQYGYSGAYQIVREETKTETKQTIVAVLPSTTTPAEMDKMLASLRA